MDGPDGINQTDDIQVPAMVANFGVMLVFWALISYLTENEFKQSPSKVVDLDGIRRRKSNRLYYMLNTDEGLKTIPINEINRLKRDHPELIYAVWALNAEQAREKITRGEGEKYSHSQNLSFAGALLNCVGWQKVKDKNDKEITRCFTFAPNCKTKSCVDDTEKRRSEGWKPKGRKLTPTESKELSGFFTSCKTYFRNAKGNLKCKKYALTCNSEAECAPKKVSKPWDPVTYSEKAVKSVAKMLADEMNNAIDSTKLLMRRIKYHGGIAPYSGGYLQEEYRDIPSKYKSKDGIKIDELAQELEMNESELVEGINKAEEARSRLPKGKSRIPVKSLMYDAEVYLAKQEEAGFSGLGQQFVNARFFKKGYTDCIIPKKIEVGKLFQAPLNKFSIAEKGYKIEKETGFSDRIRIVPQTQLSGLGKYKSWDINDTIKEAARWLKKTQKAIVYIVPTAYRGYVLTEDKPGYGRSYVEALKNGKVTEWIYDNRGGTWSAKTKQMFG